MSDSIKWKQVEAAQQVIDAIKSRLDEIQLELDQAKIELSRPIGSLTDHKGDPVYPASGQR